jgi:hypothetical protein
MPHPPTCRGKDEDMPQNYWSVICNEPNARGLWNKWLAEKCVAIGWPPPKYPLEGPTDKPGWDIARTHVQRVSQGDIIIPYLLRYRFGIPGEVVRVAVADSEWNPTVAKGGYADNLDEPELGRRIHVKWLENGVPPPDKIALVPPTDRTSGGEVKHTIEVLRPDRYARFMKIIGNPANWQPYAETKDSELSGNDEQAEPSTEPEAGKLAIQETLLRSILAKNLGRIEPSLVPHPDFPRLEEVSFELGRLDLLCMDSKKRTTIIELQLGSLDDGHIGKVCRYFGWFADKYPGKVRAILLYESATQEVLDAYKKAVPWLELRKFALTADIKLETHDSL